MDWGGNGTSLNSVYKFKKDRAKDFPLRYYIKILKTSAPIEFQKLFRIITDFICITQQRQDAA